jgi:purine-binding chemotaxis protein CheW
MKGDCDMSETTIAGINEAAEDTQQGRYLTFNLGAESFGLEIRYVREIIGMQPITPLPGLPAYIKGIINLRGGIIPVVDVRMRFGKEPLEYNDRTCIIVACFDGMDIGLIVDSVSEVLSIPDSEIVPPPEINRSSNRFIKGIGKVGNDVKLLLDYQRLLNGEDIEALALEI